MLGHTQFDQFTYLEKTSRLEVKKTLESIYVKRHFVAKHSLFVVKPFVVFF